MLVKYYRKYPLYLLIIISLSTYSISGLQSDKIKSHDIASVFNSDINDSIVSPYKQLVLLVANEFLTNDKDIFFKIYKNQRANKTLKEDGTVVKVDLLSPEGIVVKTQKHKMVDGVIHGHMKLPEKLVTSYYRLIAYTELELKEKVENIARKSIWIGNFDDWHGNGKNDKEISVRVEGGTLLANHDNRLIFNIQDNLINDFKNPVHIVDNEGNKVAAITQFSKNLGSAIFRPDAYKTYFIRQENGTDFALPKPKTQGYLLHANNLDDEDIIIKVCKGLNSQNEGLKLIAHSEDGLVSAIKNVNFNLDQILEFKLSKKDIPSGLIVLKLIDVSGNELNKRPLWINNDKINFELVPINTDSGGNSFRLNVTDDIGKPINSTVAFSIKRFDLKNYDKLKTKSSFNNDFEQIIRTIGISKPLSDRSINFIKDLAVQSYFNAHNHELNNLNIQNHKNLYLGKNGLILRGVVFDLDNKLLRNGIVQVMAITDNEISFKETITDSNGNLELKDLQLTGESRFIFRKKGETDLEKLVNFIPKDGDYYNNQVDRSKVNDKEQFDEESKIVEEFNETKSDNRSEELITLDEVEVNAENSSKETSAPSVYGIDVPMSKVSYQNYDRPKTLAQLLSEIPGVIAIQNDAFGGSVRINRAVGPALWVLDGFTLPQWGNSNLSIGGNVSNSLRDILTMLSPKDIARVEVLIGANAAIYGTRAAGGVIRIYTRSGLFDKFNARKVNQVQYKGFEPQISFNDYWDALSKRSKEKSNLIYWNPTLQLDDKGEAVIRLPDISDSSVLKASCSLLANGGISTIETSITY